MGDVAAQTDLLSVVAYGDISKLSPQDKVRYYVMTCNRLGLDPLAQPFQLLKLQGKEVLYCTRAGVQQLTKLHNISHHIVAREFVDDLYIVTARATTPDGRVTESMGVVPVPKNAPGEVRANLLMKAETKAKRRATLDLVGLGWLSEEEVDSIPDAQTEAIEVQADPIPNPTQSPPSEIEEPEEEPSQAQKRKLWAVLKEAGLTKEEAKLFYHKYASNLSRRGFSELIENAANLVKPFLEELSSNQPSLFDEEDPYETNE
ncbi:MAG: hypothetical protein QXZ28_02900 [Candidatus Methanomethylicaceae archaeon]